MANILNHACFTLSTDEIYLKQDNLRISFQNGEWVIEICLNRDNEEMPFAESGIYLCKDTPTAEPVFVNSRTCIVLWNGAEAEATELQSCFDAEISSSNLWNLPTTGFKHYVSDKECYRSYMKIELWFSDWKSLRNIQEQREGPLSCSDKIETGLEILSLDFSRLWRDGINTDVVLKVGDSTLNAHKLVLSSRSDVFKAMFEHNMTESITNTIDIKDFDIYILDIFLGYLYTGRFPQTTVDAVCDLYRIADKYAVEELKKRCSCVIACSLSRDNACHILEMADSRSDVSLKIKATNFILEHEDFLCTDEWRTFCDDKSKLAVEVYRAYVDRIIGGKTLSLPVSKTIQKVLVEENCSLTNIEQ